MDKLLIFILSASILVFPTISHASEIDQDNDGLIDRFERMIGTNPQDADSDGDGFSDREEVFSGHHPLNPDTVVLDQPLYLRDTDGDGLTDYLEANINSDYKNVDSDHDGNSDNTEIQYGYSPLDPNPIYYGKRIEINRSTQTLSYFVGPHHVNTLLVSTGIPGMDTPAGEFSVMKKLPVHLYAGSDYYFPNTKWNMMFKIGSWGNFYIHGAYWHNNFGKKMSHGCVNVSYRDMEHLYNWADLNTPVSIK